MPKTLDASLVRILTADGRVVGAGFLVSDRQVLTCAYILNQALDLPNQSTKHPQEPISLDLFTDDIVAENHAQISPDLAGLAVFERHNLLENYSSAGFYYLDNRGNITTKPSDSSLAPITGIPPLL